MFNQKYFLFSKRHQICHNIRPILHINTIKTKQNLKNPKTLETQCPETKVNQVQITSSYHLTPNPALKQSTKLKDLNFNTKSQVKIRNLFTQTQKNQTFTNLQM